jgi:hypothetical protein
VLVEFSSLAIGVVLGWAVFDARSHPSLIWCLRLLGVATALWCLSVISAGHFFLSLCGLAFGVAGHGMFIAYLKQRERE